MSDLDNEEIEATKMLNLIDEIKECAKNTTREDIIEVVEKLGIEKEKSADEIFEDENYIKKFYNKMGDSTIEEKCEILVYRYYGSEEEINTQIEFYLEDEEVGINGLLNMRVLQAINKKCKELGWL